MRPQTLSVFIEWATERRRDMANKSDQEAHQAFECLKNISSVSSSDEATLREHLLDNLIACPLEIPARISNVVDLALVLRHGLADSYILEQLKGGGVDMLCMDKDHVDVFCSIGGHLAILSLLNQLVNDKASQNAAAMLSEVYPMAFMLKLLGNVVDAMEYGASSNIYTPVVALFENYLDHEDVATTGNQTRSAANYSKLRPIEIDIAILAPSLLALCADDEDMVTSILDLIYRCAGPEDRSQEAPSRVAATTTTVRDVLAASNLLRLFTCGFSVSTSPGVDRLLPPFSLANTSKAVAILKKMSRTQGLRELLVRHGIVTTIRDLIQRLTNLDNGARVAEGVGPSIVAIETLINISCTFGLKQEVIRSGLIRIVLTWISGSSKTSEVFGLEAAISFLGCLSFFCEEGVFAILEASGLPILGEVLDVMLRHLPTNKTLSESQATALVAVTDVLKNLMLEPTARPMLLSTDIIAENLMGVMRSETIPKSARENALHTLKMVSAGEDTQESATAMNQELNQRGFLTTVNHFAAVEKREEAPKSNSFGFRSFGLVNPATLLGRCIAVTNNEG